MRDLREHRTPASPEELAGRTAVGTRPVSHVYLQSEMRELGVGVDRILHDALTVGPDPLHLSLVFNLSLAAASRYGEVAHRLLDGQLENTPPSDDPDTGTPGLQ